MVLLQITMYGSTAGYTSGTLPVVYLISNIKFLDGEGTVERPFVLSK